MRVSTNMIYDTGIAGIQQRLQSQMQLQQQVSSGLRVMKPSDDPVASAQLLNIQQAQSITDQYNTNGSSAQSQLGLEDSALSDLTNVLQNVKTQAVYAGNGVLSNSDRASLAAQLQQSYQQLLSIANRADSNGQYLFSGYQSATAPFSETVPGTVAYAGDSGERKVQIGAGTAISVSDSGEAVFRAIKNGNGTFAAGAGAGNTGGGVIGPGNVISPANWNAPANSKDFTIKFDVNNGVSPPVTTYDIVDNVNNVSLLTGAAPGAGPYLRTYVPGATIDLKTQSPPDTNPAPFDFGASVSVDGPVASGDTFTVKASTNQDIFSTLHGLITTLQTGSNGGASAAVYQNGLNAAMSGIDNALSSVLTVRAGTGAREQLATSAQSTAQNLSIQYKQRASSLQDLDLAKAISDLNQQQVSLQAAEQSFVKVTSLNLFSLLT